MCRTSDCLESEEKKNAATRQLWSARVNLCGYRSHPHLPTSPSRNNCFPSDERSAVSDRKSARRRRRMKSVRRAETNPAARLSRSMGEGLGSNMATTSRASESSVDERYLARLFGPKARSRRSAAGGVRSPSSEKREEFIKLGAAGLLGDCGGRFEPATTSTGPCGR